MPRKLSSPAQAQRAELARQLRARGESAYNIWIVRPPFEREDLILSSDATYELFYFLEGDPRYVDISYAPLRVPVEKLPPHVDLPFANVKTASGEGTTVLFKRGGEPPNLPNAFYVDLRMLSDHRMRTEKLAADSAMHATCCLVSTGHSEASGAESYRGRDSALTPRRLPASANTKRCTRCRRDCDVASGKTPRLRRRHASLVLAHPNLAGEAMKAPLYTRKTAPPEALKYSVWRPLDDSSLPLGDKLRFHTLADAIRKYCDFEPVSDCLAGSDLSRSELLRGFRRCIAVDDAGRRIGWYGAVRYARISTPSRTKALIPSGRNGRGGLSGAMCLTLKNHPSIQPKLDEYLLATARREPGREAGVRQKSAHQKFLALCKDAGIPETDWPFNALKRGRGAVRDYVIRFLRANYDGIVETQYGAKAKAKSHTGSGIASRLTAPRPFDVVEIDEHKCHFIGSLGFATPAGMTWVACERVTILTAVDRCLGVVLGFKAVFSREADGDDVLDLLALVCGMSTEPMLGCQPVAQSCLPRDLGGPFVRCGFNAVMLDNALIHLAEQVLTRARNLIGCDVNYGPTRHFERRPNVERCFGELERAGFHRLTTTTGTGPSDWRRQEPAAAACELRMEVSESLELIAAVLADINGQVTKAAFGTSRLARLKSWADDDDGVGMLFPELPELLTGTPALNLSLIPVTVRGKQEGGRRPYIYFDEEEYFGDELTDDWGRIDQTLVAHVARSDIRSFDVFTPSGGFVDRVTVRGRWSRTAHSRDLRREINAAVRNGQLVVGYDEDPVHAFHTRLSEKLAEGKRIDRQTRKELSLVADERRLQIERATTAANQSLAAILHPAADGAVSKPTSSPPDPTPGTQASAAEEDELLKLDDLRAV